MLCQTLVKKLDRLLVFLLLEVGVSNPGVRPAAQRRQIHQYRGTNKQTLYSFVSGTESLLGDLSVILTVLSAHLDGLLAQLSALIELALLKMNS